MLEGLSSLDKDMIEHQSAEFMTFMQRYNNVNVNSNMTLTFPPLSV